MDTVRLLTFNTLFRGRARARLLALGAVLERSEYDIVCLQEVMSALNLAALRKVARSYGYSAHAAAFPLVRGGLATLSRSPIIGQEFTSFARVRPVRREWGMLKGALVTHHQVGELRLAVVNTHLPVRVGERELGQLGGIVRAAEGGCPLVVAGDFNVRRDSALFGDFVAVNGLRDVLAGDREPTYRPTPRWPNPPAIDQVLVRSPAGLRVDASAQSVLREAVQLADGTEEFLSDHFGIGVRLRIGYCETRT